LVQRQILLLLFDVRDDCWSLSLLIRCKLQLPSLLLLLMAGHVSVSKITTGLKELTGSGVFVEWHLVDIEDVVLENHLCSC
jgi:hypothetical protein